MNEHGLINAMRTRLKGRVYWLKVNMPYVRGVPDVWLSGSISDLWVEVKWVRTVPMIINPAALLTINQQQWLLGRAYEGRNTGVVIGSSSGCVYYPDKSWSTPQPRDIFLEHTMTITSLCDMFTETVGEVDDAGRAYHLSGTVPSGV